MTRLGVVFLAAAVLVTAFTIVAVVDGERQPFWLVLAVLLEALTGVGLLFGVRKAAGFAAFQLGLAAVAGAASTIVDLVERGSAASLLDLGNALATTTIFVWLCGIAVFGLLAPQRRTARLTIRVIGACLAVIAASHLYLASLVGLGAALGTPLGAASVQFNLAGTSVWGFPGWLLWHGVLAVTALVMTFGSPAAQRRACNVLFVLFALLAPLTLASLVANGLYGIGSVVMILVWSCLLLPLYLIWWLTDNASRELS